MFKKTLFGLILFILIFIGSTLSFNFIQNRNRTTRAVEGYNPTMDKAYMLYEGEPMNSMLGYKNTIDTSLYRDSILPLDTSKEISVLISDKVANGADIRYELRSFDGSNLIEEGDFRFIKDNKKNYEELLGSNIYSMYQTNLRMNLNTGTEYSFVIKAVGQSETVNYYTRVVYLSDSRLDGFIQFAEKFTNAVFDTNKKVMDMAGDKSSITTFNVSGVLADMAKEKEEANKQRVIATTTDAMAGVSDADLSMIFGSLDANSVVYNNSISNVNASGTPGYVTLQSSYEDVIMNGIRMERLGNTIPKVKELTSTSALIEMRYKTISEDNDKLKTYAISEYLALDYDNGGAAIRVSDYRRYIHQDFDSDGIDSASNSLILGLSTDADPEYITNKDSDKLAFVADNSLWIYNSVNRTYSSVYGTSTDEAEMERTPQEGYNIKLLSLDDDTLNFVVYGRINEGPREGRTGVILYEYNIADTTLRELKFVSSDLCLDEMKLSVGKLAYYDKKERVFYLLIGDRMLAIDVFSGKTSDRVESLPSGHAAVSDDMKVIAYPDNADLTKTKEITIIDFAKRTEVTKSLKGHKLQLIGFVGDDIMYGAAKNENVSRGKDGTPKFLFDSLFIVHRDGNVVKKYERDNILISRVKIEGDTIYLTRKEVNEETGDISDAQDDYMTFRPKEDTETVTTEINKNELGNKELYLKFPMSVYLSSGNEELFTKVASALDTSEIEFKSHEVDKAAAYIYGPSGIRGTADSVGKAINDIYDNGGFVVDAYGSIMYREKITRPYLTVAGTFNYKAVDNPEDSFAACNYMCLLAAGVNADYDEVKNTKDFIKSFEMYDASARGINISGILLDTAISYLSDGNPFVAKIESGYVIVVSYNDDFIRYYDPQLDKEVKVQRYLFIIDCEEQGNEFYTYVK
ncbi:MAG: hypothetical protein J6M65_11675 [Eubacterium sp.]|nr:hypothetical protein [Eubacterium sp.]